MKRILSLLMLTILLTNGACNKVELTSLEQQINLLTADTWKTDSVMHAIDGDLTFQYEAFSIFFIENENDGYTGDYFLIHGGNAFQDSFGKWKFSSDMTSIIFDNDLALKAEVTKSNLNLTFTVAPPSGGRITGVSGEFTFVLKH